MMALYMKFLHLAALRASSYNLGTLKDVEMANKIINTLSSPIVNITLYLFILLSCIAIYIVYKTNGSIKVDNEIYICKPNNK